MGFKKGQLVSPKENIYVKLIDKKVNYLSLKRGKNYKLMLKDTFGLPFYVIDETGNKHAMSISFLEANFYDIKEIRNKRLNEILDVQ